MKRSNYCVHNLYSNGVQMQNAWTLKSLSCVMDLIMIMERPSAKYPPQQRLIRTSILCPHQVSKACSAVVFGGGCRGDRQDDPSSPHWFPGSCGVGSFHSVRRPAQAHHDLGSRPDQWGLSDSEELCSGSGLRRGGDGERLELLLWQVAVVRADEIRLG